MRVQRQREHFAAHTIGDRTVRRYLRSDGGLTRDWNRVVDQRADTFRLEVRPYLVATGAEDGKQMIDVSRIEFAWDDDRIHVSERIAIHAGKVAADAGPLRQQ